MSEILPENLKIPLTKELKERVRSIGDLPQACIDWISQSTTCVNFFLSEKIDPSSSKIFSKYGGNPDLPKGVDWPRSEDGHTLCFIQQIVLSEIPKFDQNPLPRSGILSFFIEDDDGAESGEGKFKILYSQEESLERKARTSKFANAIDWCEQLNEFQMIPQLGISLPSVCEEFENAAIALGGDYEKLNKYYKHLINYDALHSPDSYAGCLFGHAYGAQNNQIENAILKLNNLANDSSGKKLDFLNSKKFSSQRKELVPFWRIVSNFKVDTCFLDAGSISVYLLNNDLKNLKFENAYIEME